MSFIICFHFLRKYNCNLLKNKTINTVSSKCNKSKRNCAIVKYDKMIKQENKTIKTDISGKSNSENDSPKDTVTTKCTNQTKRKHVKIEYDNLKIKNECDSTDSEEQLNMKDIKNQKWEPPNWQKVLQNIREMRKSFDAPVDSMGCDKCVSETASAKDKRFHALISLMLSSQTKDQTTYAVMQKLINNGLSVENILNTSDKELGELIHPVGFWKKKVKFIKSTAQILKDQYDCDIPDSIQGLCKLPGVGPKMAHLCMKTAWGQTTGIGVDLHLHRICDRLGWVKNTKTPELTRQQLENWLPIEIWNEVNHLLVGFGQQICKSKPKCVTCLNNKLCPFGKTFIKNLKKKE